jgi:hypothetical protein
VAELQKRLDGGAEDAAALRDQIAVWRSIEDQTVRRDDVVVHVLEERLLVCGGVCGPGLATLTSAVST